MKELRQCSVDGRKALFHAWEQYSKIVPPSLLVGGDNGGVMARILAIVEYEDGSIGRAEVTSVKFEDKETLQTAEAPKQQKPSGSTKQVYCPYCEKENNTNATLYANAENREYFVYCDNCKIETNDIYTSKKRALYAFEAGEVQSIEKEQRRYE